MKKDPEIVLSELKRDLPFILQCMVITARLHREKYNALVLQGFTEAQALELCKVIP